MPPVYSLLELRTLPNKLLVYYHDFLRYNIRYFCGQADLHKNVLYKNVGVVNRNACNAAQEMKSG